MRRHDFDALSFLFGLLFVAAGLVLLGAGAVREGLALPWAGPAVAVGLAVLILVAVRPRAAAGEPGAGERGDSDEEVAGS